MAGSLEDYQTIIVAVIAAFLPVWEAIIRAIRKLKEFNNASRLERKRMALEEQLMLAKELEKMKLTDPEFLNLKNMVEKDKQNLV